MTTTVPAAANKEVVVAKLTISGHFEIHLILSHRHRMLMLNDPLMPVPENIDGLF